MMPETPNILCAGMLVADVLVQGVGEMPSCGETGFISDITFAIGGDAVNQAVALAKLGHRVGILGMVGNDMPGQYVRQQIAARGIYDAGLHVDLTLPTHTAIVMIDASGERSFLIRRPLPDILTGPEHIDLGLVKPGLKVLSIGSLFCAPRFDQEAVGPLLRKAKSVGAITVTDMVMDQRGYGLADLPDVWPNLDYVLPSELEAKLLTGEQTPDKIAAAFRRAGVKNVVLKRGTKGAIAWVGNQSLTCPAFKVRAMDTTGAGDNFVGGFIHALTQNMEMAGALRFASACAALSIQAVGAGAGLIDLEQVEQFLLKHP
jgi:sugar/nucleoside kinase (ribokinase family)